MRTSKVWGTVVWWGALAAAAAVAVSLIGGAASSASGTGALRAATGPRPSHRYGLRQARHQRADRATRPLRAQRGAALPSGTWQPLGPAPIGPPYLQSGNYYAGPNAGRITGLTLASLPGTATPRLIAATAGGGLWTTDNSGTGWTARSDSAATLAMGAVTTDPRNANHLIAGTGEANQCGDCAPGAGILVSTSGGTSWALQNPGSVFTNKHIAAVAIDPANSTHELAATDGGLYVTTNGGATWAKPTSSTYAALNGNVTAVAFNPVTPKTVYMAGNLGTNGAHTVAKSTDGGVTWAASDVGITPPTSNQFPLVAIGIAKSAPATMYASVGSYTLPVAFYRSTDGGATWVKQSATPDYTGQTYSYGGGTAEQGWYDNVLAVDPANASHVLAGGIALVETKNGGTSWTNVNGPSFGTGPNRIHPDHHALVFASDGSVWIGDDGGVYHYFPASQPGPQRERQPQHHPVLLRLQPCRQHGAGRLPGQRVDADLECITGEVDGHLRR